MKTVNIHEAKTPLSKLVQEASKGDPFVIAKADKPMVKVTAVGVPVGTEIKRIGFMAGQICCYGLLASRIGSPVRLAN